MSALVDMIPILPHTPLSFSLFSSDQEVAEVFSLPLEVVLRPPKGAHSYQDLEWFAPW
jgi:hypothetical protein